MFRLKHLDNNEHPSTILHPPTRTFSPYNLLPADDFLKQPPRAYLRANRQQITHLCTSAAVFHTAHSCLDPDYKLVPRLLLVQRAETDSYPGHWELPGGSWDVSDKVLQDSVARELREETGLLLISVVGQVLPCETFQTGWGQRRKSWANLAFVVEVGLGEDDVRGGKNAGIVCGAATAPVASALENIFDDGDDHDDARTAKLKEPESLESTTAQGQTKTQQTLDRDIKAKIDSRVQTATEKMMKARTRVMELGEDVERTESDVDIAMELYKQAAADSAVQEKQVNNDGTAVPEVLPIPGSSVTTGHAEVILDQKQTHRDRMVDTFIDAGQKLRLDESALEAARIGAPPVVLDPKEHQAYMWVTEQEVHIGEAKGMKLQFRAMERSVQTMLSAFELHHKAYAGRKGE